MIVGQNGGSLDECSFERTSLITHIVVVVPFSWREKEEAERRRLLFHFLYLAADGWKVVGPSPASVVRGHPRRREISAFARTLGARRRSLEYSRERIIASNGPITPEHEAKEPL